MKQIQRPNIQRASSKINPRRCLRFNDHESFVCEYGVPSAESVCRNRPTSSSKDAVYEGQSDTGLALVSGAACGGRAVTNHKLWPNVFLFLRERRVRLEAAPAPRLIHSAC